MKPTAEQERERIVAWLEKESVRDRGHGHKDPYEKGYVNGRRNGLNVVLAQIKSGKHWEGE